MWEMLLDRLLECALGCALGKCVLFGLLLKCNCVFIRALRIAPQIIPWIYFQNGQAFPDEIVMRDTLRAGFRGHEIQVSREVVAVLTSIELTYNNKKNRRKPFNCSCMISNILYDEIMLLRGGGYGRRDAQRPGVHAQELRRRGQEGDGAVQGRRGQPRAVCGEERAVPPQ